MRIAIAAVVVAALVLIAFVVGKRHARRLQRARRIHVDRFKLKRRHAEIELEVFGSRDVVHAVQRYAKEHRVPVEEARAKARQYLHEIVPKFNLLAYYRFGQPIARGLLHFLYRVVVERKPIHDFNDRAQRGTVVYVINHRSNADYVLVAYMLFRFISLSYAVGEWARVWPLNHLFKWFGAYFIRRRYREPLYHAVLSTFVQTITKNGVTQGIFIEGGLTRDGAFQKPKLGMLDYIVTAKRDAEFQQPLWLIPTSINYDRVLEDRHLTEELMGIEERSTKAERLRTTFDYLFRNTLRSVFRRFKRYGYGMVTFGAPLLVDDFIREHPAVVAETFEQRKPELQRLGEEVMIRISDALPVTPVTLAARIFTEQPVVTDAEMVASMERYQRQWRDRVWLLREKTAEEIWRAAKDVVLLRHLVVGDESGWRWSESELPLRDYYANSLLTFDEVKQRGWAEKQKFELRIPNSELRKGALS